MTTESPRRRRSTLRLITMVLIGLAAALLTGSAGTWAYAPAIGWTAAALVYVIWVWSVIIRMDAARTATHATAEDPGRGVADVLLLAANVASVAAVVVVMVGSRSADGQVKAALAALAVGSVAVSWLLVHTLFTLRYAELYYSHEPGGVDFNQDEPPQYSDFAYLAFTLGMTFQVSDTCLRNRAFRATALRHGLLAYIFGTMILATTVNFVVGLVQ